MSSKWVTGIKWVISLSLLLYLVSRLDLHQSWLAIRAFQPGYFLPIFLLSLSGFLLSTYKWQMLLIAANQTVPFGHLLRLFWIGSFFNNFLPGRTGGDVVRAYGIAKNATNQTSAVLSVFIDRGFNLVALFAMVLFILLTKPTLLPSALQTSLLIGTLTLGGIGLIAMLIIYFVFTRTQRLKHWITDSIKILTHPLRIPTIALTSIAYQTTMILSNYMVARGLGVDLPVETFFVLIPITAVITMLPISLNGWGIRESTFAVSFQPLGVSAETAVAISLMSTLCMIAISLIGGAMYLRGSLAPSDGPSICHSEAS